MIGIFLATSGRLGRGSCGGLRKSGRKRVPVVFSPRFLFVIRLLSDFGFLQYGSSGLAIWVSRPVLAYTDKGDRKA